MRRALGVTVCAVICIGILAGVGQLRQILIEHRHSEATQVSAVPRQPPVTSTAATAARFPAPASSPLPKTPTPAAPTPAIAIIIDDLGNQWPYSKRALELRGAITLAILPFSPFSERLAALAEAQGREVILHAPMEPLAHPAWRDGLSRGMGEEEMRRTLGQMLDALPTVRGVNNHMGSALTQELTAMNWIMGELGQRGLYFIDSRTSPRSQALSSARKHAVPSARRDVFLDNIRSPEAISRQFDALIRIAHKRGQAIAIGHPYPETLAFLEQALDQLDQRGVRLVPASQLLEPTPDTSVASDTKIPTTFLSPESHRQTPTTPSKSI